MPRLAPTVCGEVSLFQSTLWSGGTEKQQGVGACNEIIVFNKKHIYLGPKSEITANVAASQNTFCFVMPSVLLNTIDRRWN